jgi:hypothetical protein
VEFSILIRTGVKIDEMWLYIFDTTPMFIGVMAFAIVLPYDIPYARMFKSMSRKAREKERQRTERQALAQDDTPPPAYAEHDEQK